MEFLFFKRRDPLQRKRRQSHPLQKKGPRIHYIKKFLKGIKKRSLKTVDITFFLYPLLLAGTLGLWWLPFFFWKENSSLKKIAGILLWWVNIPLYCLMLGPGLEKAQPFLHGIYALIARYSGLVLMIFGVVATLLFIIPRWQAGGPGYDATKLQIKGAFAIMRHPQLASAWFIAIGWSLWQGALYGLVSAALYLVVLRAHAAMEEKHLLIPVFGEDYLAYRKKVKAFIPYLI